MTARIERLVTSGTFSLDGGTWDVDNNVWLIGDDNEVLVVDPAHDAEAIVRAIGERDVVGIVCTHGHNDHINASRDVAREVEGERWLHPDDRILWDEVLDEAPEHSIDDGLTWTVADTTLTAVHTPGHSPGSCCLYAPDLGVVLSGDTLFAGGPGATGRSYSDFPTIIESIRTRLLVLPPDTRVLTGHGDDTTIGTEAPHLDEWIARGH